LIRLTRHSEHFPPSGGVGARAAHRALGPHRLGFWELFLRETIQNSWDARRSAEGPISFGVHAWTATPSQRAFLRDFILTDPPPDLDIPVTVNHDPLALLVVADSGTWGLGGPTRADIDPSSVPGGRTDFVDLIRDTGRRAAKGLGGGTYGFGKAVLCQASAVSTMVIYSRTDLERPQSSRFIAMAIANDEYLEQGIRYTGRHWWGIAHDGVAEPVLGADADAAAAALGLHGLITGPTGTAVMVIAPRTPEDEGPADLAGIVRAIADAAAEYAWPHMIAGPAGRPTIELAVTLDGTFEHVRDPTTDTRLRVFAEAYTRCQQLLEGSLNEGDDWPWYLRMLRSLRPICQLGPLVWRHHGPIAPAGPDPDIRSEIALVRSPRFVVSYMHVPKHPSGQSTFGVFLADPDLDGDFAEAEPPAHDAWIPTKGKHFDPVRRVQTQIADLLKPRPAPDVSRDGREEPGVVTVASALGGLLDGQSAGGDIRVPWSPPNPPSPPGSATTDSQPRRNPDSSTAASSPEGGVPEGGATGATGTAPRASARQRASVRHDGQPRLLITYGRAAVEFPFAVYKPRGEGAIRVTVRPDVFIDGGRETEPPLGAEVPELLEWHDLATGSVSRGPDVVITRDGESRWSVVISQPADAAVTVALSVAGP
jgi:hypothetical protein